MHYQIHEKLTNEGGVLEQAVIADSKDTFINKLLWNHVTFRIRKISALRTARKCHYILYFINLRHFLWVRTI